MDNFVEQAKPYAIGLVGGLVLAPVVALTAGWLVTAGAMAEAVETARVDQLAAICAAEAEETWLAQNRSMDELTGWDNRDVRNDLVTQVLGGFAVASDIRSDVSYDCNGLLSS